MRILIVTRNLPPLVGGMERLNWHMAEELAKVADVRIVGPAGAAAAAPAGIDVREAPLKPLWKFLLCARVLTRREAKAWHPDLVLAGSGLTAPIARSAARIGGAKAVVYVHGLDLAVKHHVYRAIWIPALRRMDRVIANSRATAGLCRDIGIHPARIGIVHPGVDMSDRVGTTLLREKGGGEGSPPVQTAGEFRQRHNLANRPLLLSVGRLSARKGLREFVAQCLPRIIAAQPDVVLLIVGDAPKDALHAQTQTPGSIRIAAGQAGVAENLRFLGKINDDELTAAFCAADVHVFPVREIAGDPEGFGMVAVEAAAHGLPTVAFAAGGVVDAVSEGQSGHLVPPGDYIAFADIVLRTLAARDTPGDGCMVFAQRFAWPEFGVQIAAQLRLI